MILLTTIIMIVILTMLVLSLMQAVFLYFKVSNQVVIKHEELYQLEAVAFKLVLEKQNPLHADCTLTDTNPNQVVDMLLHNGGCSLIDNHRQYYYLIDNLGLQPCLQIFLSGKMYSSHHWLISVATPPPRQTVLQLRVADSARPMTCELSEAHQISPGVLSWRYLP